MNLNDEEISDAVEQPNTSHVSSASTNPAAVLRALLTRLPAPSSSSPPPSHSQYPSERESDFDLSEHTNATPSVAQESLKSIFSKARRDPGDTPRKEKPRRSSFDSSEVDATPGLLQRKTDDRGKRRSLSDDEGAHFTELSKRFGTLRKPISQPVTMEFLRERFSHSNNYQQPNPSSPVGNSSNETATVLRELDSSQFSPPMATSTPQQSLRLSVNSQFQSNLLDQDSEMQHAIGGLESSADEKSLLPPHIPKKKPNLTSEEHTVPTSLHRSLEEHDSRNLQKSSSRSSIRSSHAIPHNSLKSDVIGVEGKENHSHGRYASHPRHYSHENLHLLRVSPSPDYRLNNSQHSHVHHSKDRLKPSSRATSPSENSSISINNDSDVDLVNERERNWNSPHPIWHSGTHSELHSAYRIPSPQPHGPHRPTSDNLRSISRTRAQNHSDTSHAKHSNGLPNHKEFSSSLSPLLPEPTPSRASSQSRDTIYNDKDIKIRNVSNSILSDNGLHSPPFDEGLDQPSKRTTLFHLVREPIESHLLIHREGTQADAATSRKKRLHSTSNQTLSPIPVSSPRNTGKYPLTLNGGSPDLSPSTPPSSNATHMNNNFVTPSPSNGLLDLPTLSSGDESLLGPITAPSDTFENPVRDFNQIQTSKSPGVVTPQQSHHVSTAKFSEDLTSSAKFDNEQDFNETANNLGKSPRPPGGWISTPASLKNTEYLSAVDDVSLPSGGLLTPVASLSKGAYLRTQSPVVPGAWANTPGTRRSILKVRFNPEPSQLFENELQIGHTTPPLDPTKTHGDESDVPLPPSPCSLRKSPVSNIRFLDAFGREKNESELHHSRLRIVDAMGREIPKEDSSVKAELTVESEFLNSNHRELLSEIRRGLDNLGGEFDEEHYKESKLDFERIEKLKLTSSQARKSRELLLSNLRSKEISHPDATNYISSRIRLTRRTYLVLLLLQFLVVYMTYQLAMVWLEDRFLNFYHDPFHPELQLYLFNSENTFQFKLLKARPVWYSLHQSLSNKGGKSWSHWCEDIQVYIWDVWNKKASHESRSWFPT